MQPESELFDLLTQCTNVYFIYFMFDYTIKSFKSALIFQRSVP